MSRIILHCDLNNFFASATLSQNPTLAALPVAICGDSEKRHGIVLAKNSVAKGYGILTAETIWQARKKCPELITVPPNYRLYESISKKAHKIYLDYTDRVEPFGIDECWLEITNPKVDFLYGERVAQEIRERVKKELGITVSIGVSFTKSLAKLGSDLKKPDAVTVIDREYLVNKIWPKPCNELLMVGKSSFSVLNSMGVFTVGDLANSNIFAVVNKLGKNGAALVKTARGEDDFEVTSYYEHQKPKSIGHSATAEKDLTSKEEVFAAFLEFSEGISHKLRAEGLYAGTVAVHILTNEFEGKEFRCSLDLPTDMSMTIAKSAMAIFEKNNCLAVPLRAVGVRVLNLTDKTDARQLSLFTDTEAVKNEEIIEKEILDIRKKYGKSSLKRAACMENKAKPSSPGFYKK